MPREIITKLELIEQLAERKWDENWRFRTFIKWRDDRKSEEIDELVRETTDEVWRQIDCTDCANCCRKLQIVVDCDDIDRLAQHFRLTAKEFRKRHVVKGEDGELVLNRRPCPFLEGNICSVYDHRPKACHDFPYLHAPEFRTRMMMMVQNTTLCPIVYNTMEQLKDRLGFRRKRRR